MQQAAGKVGIRPSGAVQEVVILGDRAGVNQKTSIAELIASMRKIEEEIAAHGELNEPNLLLRDFAMELLKQKLLLRVEFVQMMESSRPKSRAPFALGSSC
jgi:hypothetical protein